MQSSLAHIQFNVRAENLPFYKDLCGFLGWQTIYEDETTMGMAGKHGESFWFSGEARDVRNDDDGPGVNHLGIGVEAQSDVDAAGTYLTKKGVDLLFETPRHRPDFAEGEGQTYYQIMFETPDRILLEVVYTGPGQD
jgi:catechol 2,3-dioxygenase-like lactoylglutathione lyase family enzyme